MKSVFIAFALVSISGCAQVFAPPSEEFLAARRACKDGSVDVRLVSDFPGPDGKIYGCIRNYENSGSIYYGR